MSLFVHHGLRRWLAAIILALAVCLSPHTSQAAIIGAGFFSGTLERFDFATNTQSTFATLASADDQFPGLSGVAFDAVHRRLYASARFSNRIYAVNADTGAVLGFHELSTGATPSGLTVDSSGNIYVALAGTNSIGIFDSNFGSLGSISLAGRGPFAPTGLGFDNQGRLLISDFVGGLFRYDAIDDSVTSLAGPTANAQIAVDGSGNIYVGTAVDSNDVRKFMDDGTEIGSPFLSIDDALLPQPDDSYASPDFTSPSGVLIDPDGNLIVGALGRTNPFDANDNFQSNGGLWKFSTDGTLIESFDPLGTLTPISGLAYITAVPEPSSLALLALGWGVFCWRQRRRQQK